MEDMTLSLRPEGAGREEEPRRAVIAVTDEITPENVVRRVVSAYLIGYTLIQIRNPMKRIDLAQKRAVKDFTRRKLIGTEIVSDLPRELTLQVLLGRSELSVTDALRRMSVIAASMHREAVIALGTDDARLAREVMAIDDEVDRFGLYIIRLLKEAAVDTYSMREIGLTSAREGLGYRLITKSVERMADHAVNIAQNSLALTLSGLGDDLMGGLRPLSEEAVVRRIIKNAAPGDVPALRLIVESVMRTAEYGADVAEVVLNLTIRDEIRAG